MRAERGIAAATVDVTLPPALLALFPGAPMTLALPAADAADVAEVLDALDARWPGMRDRLCDSRPAIRPHIQLFVDGERSTLATPLRPGAEVVFLTAVSGG
jgi:molybdopterin converting factor small subunit